VAAHRQRAGGWFGQVAQAEETWSISEASSKFCGILYYLKHFAKQYCGTGIFLNIIKCNSEL
jgi:hypothetical protein